MFTLHRPLVIFDIEATGLNIASDRIVELAYIKLYPNGKKESESFRFNPGIEIKPEAVQVHGITNDDVKDCPSFGDYKAKILSIFDHVDLCGFNSDHFDIPLLVEECLRNEIPLDLSKAYTVDVQNIFHKMEQRTLSAALQFYCNEALTEAHEALADTTATLKVLEAQLHKYGQKLPANIKELSSFSRRNHNVDYAGRMIYNDKKQEVFNFGKYKGQVVSEVLEKDPGFYAWIMQNDFAQNTKQMLTQIRLRKLNTKNA